MNKNGILIKLREIVDVTQGQSPKSAHYSKKSGTPFLQGNKTFGSFYPTFDTYTSKVTKIAKQGEVLISVRAPVGDLNIAPMDLCIGRGLASLNSKVGSNHFIYYALKHSIANLQRQGAATTYSSVNKDIINDFDVIVPKDKNSWDKIAKILFSLDNKIELNNKTIIELEKTAKTIYDFWFVQLDFPNEVDRPFKSSGGKMVWNGKLNKEIPTSWRVNLLGNSLKTVLGGTPSTNVEKYWNNGSINWLSSSETECYPVINSVQRITQAGVDNSATELLPKGSVIISIVRYIRPSILAIDACTNQSVVGILESDDLKNYYIYPLLVNEVPRLMSIRTGAQQPHINKASIDETLIIIPPKELLSKYYDSVKPIYDKIINTAFENDILIKLREWLLPMLMNGQVTIQ